jgi:hypothetical protein
MVNALLTEVVELGIAAGRAIDGAAFEAQELHERGAHSASCGLHQHMVFGEDVGAFVGGMVGRAVLHRKGKGLANGHIVWDGLHRTGLADHVGAVGPEARKGQHTGAFGDGGAVVDEGVHRAAHALVTHHTGQGRSVLIEPFAGHHVCEVDAEALGADAHFALLRGGDGRFAQLEGDIGRAVLHDVVGALCFHGRKVGHVISHRSTEEIETPETLISSF